jgi:sugar phosphate isomerase/epimerase
MELKDYSGKLEEMLEHGERNSPKYEKFLAEAVAARETKKKPFFERVEETLRKILPEAEKSGLKFGCENREAVEELPLENDFKLFLAEFRSPQIAYWHDCGHAQIKENLGFIRHAEFLGSLAPRLAGFHVHDVQFPARDHCAPGTGMIDFAALKPFVQPEHIKVFELSPKIPVEEVKRGIAHLKKIWGGE